MPATGADRDRRAVEEAMRGLPGRYRGAPPGFEATFELRLGDIGRVWQLRCDAERVRVIPGGSRRRADVVVGTDAATWLALREGELSGIEAFASRRLTARGKIDLAMGLEGLFDLPDGRAPRMVVRDVALSHGRTISTLTTGGEGSDVVLIHGLGSAKTSFVDTIPALERAGHRVHAIDLPGFGSSSAPLGAPCTARWFSDAVLEWMDAMGIRTAHVVGNSMGGRIAIELGLRAPGRVGSLVLLAPAVAFVRRSLHPLVRVLRPEFGLFPHAFSERVVRRQLAEMFADPDALDPAVAEVAVDEFREVYRSAGARLAFLRSARNIYLDRPFGRGGFYPRLAGLDRPALFVWGSDDPLIPPGFSRHVREWLPGAEQVVLDDCGHVPQIERAPQVDALIGRTIAAAERAAAGRQRTAPERRLHAVPAGG